MRTITFKFLFTIILALIYTHTYSQKKDTLKSARYIEVIDGYLMVLKQGDNLFDELSILAKNEQIPAANISGMGFAEVELGYFNSETKKYKSKKYKGELASMLGTIAWQDGTPSIHAHGIITGKNFKAYGGHILSAVVGTGTVEILIQLHDEKLERIKDEALGANILCLENCNK